MQHVLTAEGHISASPHRFIGPHWLKFNKIGTDPSGTMWTLELNLHNLTGQMTQPPPVELQPTQRVRVTVELVDAESSTALPHWEVHDA